MAAAAAIMQARSAEAIALVEARARPPMIAPEVTRFASTWTRGSALCR
jgi:hypothetical protein